MIMLDTNHCLSFEPSCLGSPPMGDDMEKAGLNMDHDRHVYHSLKEGGQSVAAHSQQRNTISDMICVYCMCLSLQVNVSILWFHINS